MTKTQWERMFLFWYRLSVDRSASKPVMYSFVSVSW